MSNQNQTNNNNNDRSRSRSRDRQQQGHGGRNNNGDPNNGNPGDQPHLSINDQRNPFYFYRNSTTPGNAANGQQPAGYGVRHGPAQGHVTWSNNTTDAQRRQQDQDRHRFNGARRRLNFDGGRHGDQHGHGGNSNNGFQVPPPPTYPNPHPPPLFLPQPPNNPPPPGDQNLPPPPPGGLQHAPQPPPQGIFIGPIQAQGQGNGVHNPPQAPPGAPQQPPQPQLQGIIPPPPPPGGLQQGIFIGPIQAQGQGNGVHNAHQGGRGPQQGGRGNGGRGGRGGRGHLPQVQRLTMYRFRDTYNEMNHRQYNRSLRRVQNPNDPRRLLEARYHDIFGHHATFIPDALGYANLASSTVFYRAMVNNNNNHITDEWSRNLVHYFTTTGVPNLRLRTRRICQHLFSDTTTSPGEDVYDNDTVRNFMSRFLNAHPRWSRTRTYGSLLLQAFAQLTYLHRIVEKRTAIGYGTSRAERHTSWTSVSNTFINGFISFLPCIMILGPDTMQATLHTSLERMDPEYGPLWVFFIVPILKMAKQIFPLAFKWDTVRRVNVVNIINTNLRKARNKGVYSNLRLLHWVQTNPGEEIKWVSSFNFGFLRLLSMNYRPFSNQVHSLMNDTDALTQRRYSDHFILYRHQYHIYVNCISICRLPSWISIDTGIVIESDCLWERPGPALQEIGNNDPLPNGAAVQFPERLEHLLFIVPGGSNRTVDYASDTDGSEF